MQTKHMAPYCCWRVCLRARTTLAPPLFLATWSSVALQASVELTAAPATPRVDDALRKSPWLSSLLINPNNNKHYIYIYLQYAMNSECNEWP